MIYKDVANSVLKFGRILFTPIWLTAVACCASGPLKVRLSFLSQNVPPPSPKPLYKHRYIRTLSICAFFPADWGHEPPGPTEEEDEKEGVVE
jgi:hypothetical protein